MVLASALYSSGGGGKAILIPNGINGTAVPIPIQLIKSDNNFSSSGNFTLEDFITYSNNFTINTSHQMTVPANTLKVIYAGGTVTIGGNGIIGGQTTGAGGGSPAVSGAAGSNAVIPNHWHFIQGLASNGTGGGGAATFIGGAIGGYGGGSAAGGGSVNNTNTGGQAGNSRFVTLLIIANAITITANIDFTGSNAPTPGHGGGGGGCGGNLLLFANTITHSGGTINVSGGNGATTAGYAGGGGGHTGLIFMQGTTLSLSGGTRTATAGTGGTGPSGNGTAGYAQTIRTITGNPF